MEGFLWTARRAGSAVGISVRLVPYRMFVDGAVVMDGSLLYTMLFETDREFAAWFDHKRRELEAGGWAVCGRPGASRCNGQISEP